MRGVAASSLLALLIAGSACKQQAQVKHASPATPLSLTPEQCEAIRTAESFVRENGYTTAAAAEDRSKISWELGDDPTQVDRVLTIRRDTLKPHAYGLQLGVPGDPVAWTVVFEYTDRVLEITKRAEGETRSEPAGAVVRVKLDAAGAQAVKGHTPILLSAVTTRLSSPEEVSAACVVAAARTPAS